MSVRIAAAATSRHFQTLDARDEGRERERERDEDEDEEERKQKDLAQTVTR